jgi:hypothetical protein
MLRKIETREEIAIGDLFYCCKKDSHDVIQMFEVISNDTVLFFATSRQNNVNNIFNPKPVQFNCLNDEWDFYIIEPKDIILYSYLKYKTSRYWELLKNV